MRKAILLGLAALMYCNFAIAQQVIDLHAEKLPDRSIRVSWRLSDTLEHRMWYKITYPDLADQDEVATSKSKVSGAMGHLEGASYIPTGLNRSGDTFFFIDKSLYVAQRHHYIVSVRVPGTYDSLVIAECEYLYPRKETTLEIPSTSVCDPSHYVVTVYDVLGRVVHMDPNVEFLSKSDDVYQRKHDEIAQKKLLQKGTYVYLLSFPEDYAAHYGINPRISARTFHVLE